MSSLQRRKIQVRGTVQGVGFRPFVFRLATSLGLCGSVRNTDGGVVIEAQGSADALDALISDLQKEAPALARVASVTSMPLPLQAEGTFAIVPSTAAAERTALIPPDAAPCAECLAELFDPGDRRHRYPFINCVNCGPRYTIAQGLPYDRSLTTMRPFRMCEACGREYRTPADRRFHAQPNACPACGPRLWIAEPAGGREIPAIDPTATAAAALREGRIVAIKGIGGLHLACSAHAPEAVRRLRERKGREAKPFALMVADLDAARELCEVSDAEAGLLESPARPIVLLTRRDGTRVVEAVAPGNRMLGLMLPSSPLHALLMRDAGVPLVMTSGNASEEPIAFGNEEALSRLGAIAELFLLHDREIFVPCDDSVSRVIDGAPCLLRRGRGHVIEAEHLSFDAPPLLALGGDLKGAILLAEGRRGFASQHLGDLTCLQAEEGLRRTVDHLRAITRIEPRIVAHDLHPDYASTRIARELAGRKAKLVGVQHHHAHIAACMAEHGLPNERAIGIALDGAGYGPDGTIWGGELLIADYAQYERAAHLRTVALPGGDAASREPWRMALSHLMDAGIVRPDSAEGWQALPFAQAVGEERIQTMLQLIARNVQCLPTSSCGRLFDAVAAIAGLCSINRYEGEAAMRLEQAACPDDCGAYPFALQGEEIDLRPMLRQLFEEAIGGQDAGQISARFHATVAAAFAAACRALRERDATLRRACLSGGCLQNALLARLLRSQLQAAGFEVFRHGRVPPNDGGIALGQAVVAAAREG